MIARDRACDLLRHATDDAAGAGQPLFKGTHRSRARKRHGACSGCPSSAATLRAGVENMLRHYVPEVTRVEQTL